MTHRRNNFPSSVKREAYERSKVNGIPICECHLIPHVFANPCGLPLGDGNTFYEHIDPDKISGRSDLENCAALTRGCWRYKTDSYDRKVIAKNDHQYDGARGIKSRWSKKLPGGRDDPFKMKLAGNFAKPVDRKTGQPWRSGR